MIKLKNCPFCGSPKVRYYTSVSTVDEKTGQDYDLEGNIHCDNCDARGPYVLSIGKTDVRRFAVEAWNQRAGDQTT